MLRTVTSTPRRAHTTSSSCQIFHVLRRFVRHASSNEHGSARPDTSASTKLWRDAMEEDKETLRSTKPPTHINEYPNWTGEESVQDAVLRMLVDKYKPLRGGSIMTAEEKIKAAPPNVAPLEPDPLPALSDNPPLVASTSPPKETVSPETHKPWLTTFRAPSHATSVRYMRLPLSPPSIVNARTQGSPIHPDDSRSRIEQREKKRKAAFTGRLENARESSLDYKIGKTAAAPRDLRTHRPNPVSIKGWKSLVEERIERARNEGHFRSVKGRGKPIAREIEQSNPFIPREEFLMNRIVQRQGAAPPWVEIQGELEAAVTSFRAVLRSAWTRRAVRTLMLEHPPPLLARFTLVDVSSARLRDREWEAREAGYHDVAVNEVNALVRKYNGVAPYTVRRNYLSKAAELERMYEISGEYILAEIKRRIEANPTTGMGMGSFAEEAHGSSGQGGGGGKQFDPLRFNLRAIWSRWIARFVGS